MMSQREIQICGTNSTMTVIRNYFLRSDIKRRRGKKFRQGGDVAEKFKIFPQDIGGLGNKE